MISERLLRTSTWKVNIYPFAILANLEREWNGAIYLFTSPYFPHDCANAATKPQNFSSPRRVSTSRYLVALAGRRNRIIAEQRGTAAAAAAGGGGGRILSRRNGSEWKSETRLAPLARERVRLSSKRSLRRRDIGHSNEIVAFAPPGRPAILTQLRYESVSPLFSVSFSPLQEAAPSSSVPSRSGTRSFSLLFRFDERRVRVRALPTTSRHLRVFVVAKGSSRRFSGISFYRRGALSLSAIPDLCRENGALVIPRASSILGQVTFAKSRSWIGVSQNFIIRSYVLRVLLSIVHGLSWLFIYRRYVCATSACVVLFVSKVQVTEVHPTLRNCNRRY